LDKDVDNKIRIRVMVGSSERELLVVYPSELPNTMIAAQIRHIIGSIEVNNEMAKVNRDSSVVRVISDGKDIFGITVFDSEELPLAV